MFIRNFFNDHLVKAVVIVLFTVSVTVIILFAVSTAQGSDKNATPLYRLLSSVLPINNPAEVTTYSLKNNETDYLVEKTPDEQQIDFTSLNLILCRRHGGKWTGVIKNPFYQDYRNEIKLTIRNLALAQGVRVTTENSSIFVPMKQYSKKVSLIFKTPADGYVTGTLCFYLDSRSPELRLYRSRIQYSFEKITEKLLTESDFDNNAIDIIRLFDTAAPEEDDGAIQQGSYKQYVHIRIPENRLYVKRWDTMLQRYVTVCSFVIAPGRPNRPSPLGRGIIYGKGRIVFRYLGGERAGQVVKVAQRFPGDEERGPVPYDKMRALYINVGGQMRYVIHSTTEYWNMGKMASAGCIRVGIDDMLKLYPIVQQDTPLHIEYETIDIHDGFITVYPDYYRRGTNTFSHAGAQLKKAGINIRLVDRHKLMELLENPESKPIPITALLISNEYTCR